MPNKQQGLSRKDFLKTTGIATGAARYAGPGIGIQQSVHP